MIKHRLHTFEDLLSLLYLLFGTHIEHGPSPAGRPELLFLSLPQAGVSLSLWFKTANWDIILRVVHKAAKDLGTSHQNYTFFYMDCCTHWCCITQFPFSPRIIHYFNLEVDKMIGIVFFFLLYWITIGTYREQNKLNNYKLYTMRYIKIYFFFLFKNRQDKVPTFYSAPPAQVTSDFILFFSRSSVMGPSAPPGLSFM